MQEFWEIYLSTLMARLSRWVSVQTQLFVAIYLQIPCPVMFMIMSLLHEGMLRIIMAAPSVRSGIILLWVIDGQNSCE